MPTNVRERSEVLVPASLLGVLGLSGSRPEAVRASRASDHFNCLQSNICLDARVYSPPGFMLFAEMMSPKEREMLQVAS